MKTTPTSKMMNLMRAHRLFAICLLLIIAFPLSSMARARPEYCFLTYAGSTDGADAVDGSGSTARFAYPMSAAGTGQAARFCAPYSLVVDRDGTLELNCPACDSGKTVKGTFSDLDR